MSLQRQRAEGWAVYAHFVDSSQGVPRDSKFIESDYHLTKASAEAWLARHQPDKPFTLFVDRSHWYVRVTD